MSNRALAILGFIIFMVVFWYQLHVMHQSVDELKEAVEQQRHAQTATAEQPDVMAFLVQNELEYFDGVVGDYLAKIQPDLKPEIRYREFEKLVFEKRGSHGRLRWKPLRTTFGSDYDALAERFHKEYPSTEIPTE